MLGGSFKKMYGSAVVAAYLRGQKTAPYWPREKLDSIRDRHIRQIVAYAAKHVPYYRDLFSRERIDPAQIKTAADLDRLPLLDRDLVRSQPKLFLAETDAARNGLSFLTSGSTGTPIQIYHDQRSLLANIAFGERERVPVNQACGSFRPKELYVGYETSTFKKVIAFYEKSVLFPVRPRRRFISLLEPIDKIAAVMDEEKPDVLVGYGGWVDLFFKTMSVRGIKVRLPKMVMYIGETLPHGGREFIETQFGVQVMSRYNAVESFKIGFYCEARSGFHLHDDICHVRIVKPDGTPAQTGEQGQVVISNLINRASVLLNYPMGDVAALSGETCSCGRTFRLLSELEGRVEDLLPLPDGQTVHPRSVWQIFKDDREVIQYQLTQHEPQRFELTVVTTDAAAFERAMGRALPSLRQLLSSDSRIDVKHQTESIRTPGAKFRAVASKCRQHTIAQP